MLILQLPKGGAKNLHSLHSMGIELATLLEHIASALILAVFEENSRSQLQTQRQLREVQGNGGVEQFKSFHTAEIWEQLLH